MSKETKQAKLALKSKKKANVEQVSAFMMISDGHRVSRNATGKTDCGEYMTGWRYGTVSDITCKYVECINGINNPVADLEVNNAEPLPVGEHDIGGEG